MPLGWRGTVFSNQSKDKLKVIILVGAVNSDLCHLTANKFSHCVFFFACAFIIIGYVKNNKDVKDDPMMDILRDRKKLRTALGGVLDGNYEDAEEDAKSLWSFIWTELLAKVIPAPGKATENLFHESYQQDVDAEVLMKYAPVSDEALVLTILSVKGDILEVIDDDNTAISDITQPTASVASDEDDNDDGGGEEESIGKSASSKRKKNSSGGESVPVIVL